jgi:hypothetical protein
MCAPSRGSVLCSVYALGPTRVANLGQPAKPVSAPGRPSRFRGPTGSPLVPKRNYGFEKRQKELNRQRKKEEKRQRKLDRAKTQDDEAPAEETTLLDQPAEE